MELNWSTKSKFVKYIFTNRKIEDLGWYHPDRDKLDHLP